MRSLALRGIGVLAALALACQSAPAPGARCARDGDCSGALVCRMGRCRTGCAAQRDCPVPQLCLRDATGIGSCGLGDDPLCDGTLGSCADGLSCIDRACVNACHAIADCPAGSACVTQGGLARCVRADLDAGVADDGGVPCHGPRCDAVLEVAVDTQGACVRTQSGAVWCWGNVIYLGNGAMAHTCATSGLLCSSVPTQVLRDELGRHDPLDGVSRVATTNGIVCALAHGRPFCWGEAFSAALGTTTPDGVYARPVLPDAGGTLPSDFVDITVGEAGAFALRASAVEFWGDASRAELGTGVDTLHTLAIPAPAIPSGGVVRFGSRQVCSLAGGVVSCWGANGDGEAGGTHVGMDQNVDTPTPIAGLPSGDLVRAISPGRDHTCALTDGGDVWCWGERIVLGVRADPPGCRMGVSRLACPPTRVTRGSMRYVALATSPYADAACAIDDAGAVWCWGEDDAGRFPLHGSGEPVQIPGLPPIDSMSLGERFACAIDRDHDLWCWGVNDMGQLGLGNDDANTHATPARVVFPQ